MANFAHVSLASVAVIAGACGIVSPGVMPVVPSGGATMLFCAHGGESFTDSEFAEVVVAINSDKSIANVSLSRFDIFGARGLAYTLRGVVWIERFNDTSPRPNIGYMAYYMRPEMADYTHVWDGALPRSTILLRLRMKITAVGDEEMAERCSLQFGPYNIEGSLDGDWPTS